MTLLILISQCRQLWYLVTITVSEDFAPSSGNAPPKPSEGFLSPRLPSAPSTNSPNTSSNGSCSTQTAHESLLRTLLFPGRKRPTLRGRGLFLHRSQPETYGEAVRADCEHDINITRTTTTASDLSEPRPMTNPVLSRSI